MKLRYMLAIAGALLCGSQAHAQGFTDTWMGIRDGLTMSNPGGNFGPANEKGSRDVNKVIPNFGHFDAGDYGSNFVNLDVLLSNPNEVAANSSGGSTEFYFVYRGQLSPDKFLGLNTKFGPVKAINFEWGGDLEGENNAFGADKKAIVGGPNINFDVPGVLNLGIHVYHEWNHNGYCTDGCKQPGGPINFNTTAEFEIVWLFPLKFTNLPLDFRGFMNIVLPKGRDGFGNETKTEVLTRQSLYLDIGDMIFHKPNKLYTFFQVEVWENKFGNDHTKTAGCEEISPVFGIEYHF